MTQINLKFDEWLLNQTQRVDHVGELARLLVAQPVDAKAARRKQDEHKGWVEIVIRIAEPGYIFIFNEAWQEFLLARQALDAGAS